MTRVGLAFSSDARPLPELADLIAEAKQAGFTCLQTYVSWAWVEPQAGQFDWHLLDQAAQLAQDAGLPLHVQVNTTPEWLHTDIPLSTSAWVVPRDAAERASMVAYVTALATRFKGRVAAYEIWNEPNISEFAYPGPDTDTYALMLIDVSAAIRAADPAAKIVTGGLSRCSVGYADHMLTMLEQHGAPHDVFDMFGVHPYSDNHPPIETKPRTDTDSHGGEIELTFSVGIDKIVGVLDAHGHTDKRLWLGEYGHSLHFWPTGPIAEHRRAMYAHMAATVAKDHPRVAGIVPYTWLPDEYTHEGWCVAGEDSKPRPSYRAWAATARGSMTATAMCECAPAGPPGTPRGTLSGTVTLAPEIVGIADRSDITSHDIYINGQLAQPDLPGRDPVIDTRELRTGDTVAVAWYAAGEPVRFSRTWPVEVESVFVHGIEGTLDLALDGRVLTATMDVNADPAIDVDMILVAARDAADGNYDIGGWFNGPIRIGPSGAHGSWSRELPAGTYRCWIAWASDGAWDSLPEQNITVT